MPDNPTTNFLTHRFITDAIGHLVASYAAFGAIYVIDNVSHTPSKFNHLVTLALAAAYILMDFVIAKWLGNVKYFGLISLLMASILGFGIFVLGMESVAAIQIGIAGTSLYGAFVMSPIFLIPAVIGTLIIRLMAFPIVRHFRPQDHSLRIPSERNALARE